MFMFNFFGKKSKDQAINSHYTTTDQGLTTKRDIDIDKMYSQYIKNIESSPNFQEYKKNYPKKNINDWCCVIEKKEFAKLVENAPKPPKECSCGHNCGEYSDFRGGYYEGDPNTPPKECTCDPNHNCSEYRKYYYAI